MNNNQNKLNFLKKIFIFFYNLFLKITKKNQSKITKKKDDTDDIYPLW
jgi:hypothetical protein